MKVLSDMLLQRYFNVYFNVTSMDFEATSTQADEGFIAEIAFPFAFLFEQKSLIHEILDHLFSKERGVADA